MTVSLAGGSGSGGDAAGDSFSGIENLYGSALADSLTGDDNANILSGGAGNDTLSGGLGNDLLTGGAGNDTFMFLTAIGSGNVDRINDFNVADDLIYLEGAVFIGLNIGNLTSESFTTNTDGIATTNDHRVIYESDNGRLYFDADGAQTGARVHFATLNAGLSITEADFLVI